MMFTQTEVDGVPDASLMGNVKAAVVPIHYYPRIYQIICIVQMIMSQLERKHVRTMHKPVVIVLKTV